MWVQSYDYLEHHGIKGQKWGVRRYQNPDGTLTDEGKRRYAKRVFVSGSSKTQDETSVYYRKELPNQIKDRLRQFVDEKAEIIVGDAPGIDRQVQNFLNDLGYSNVQVYGPGKKVRYSANSKWKTNPIDAPEFEVGSREWLAKKDLEMEKASTEGLAIVLDEGSKATRKNIDRLISNNKFVDVFELSKGGKDRDRWANRLSHDSGFAKETIDMYQPSYDYLEHHGVLGMKWGIRRYQNYDGSLTAAGKIRYQSSEALAKDIRRDFAGAKSYSDKEALAKKWNKSISEAKANVYDLDKYDRNNEIKTRPYSSHRKANKKYAVDWVVSNNPDLLKKAEQYERDVNSIYKSMTDAEKKFVTGNSYNVDSRLIWEADAIESVRMGTAFVEKYRNKPISFMYIQNDDWSKSGNVVIGTRSGEQYRGKGYASKNVEKAKEWLKNNDYGTVRLEWMAFKANTPSRQLAVRSGFKADVNTNKRAKRDYDDTKYVLKK